MHFYQLIVRVRDIEKSIRFYEEFVGLTIQKRQSTADWHIAFLADQEGATQIELVYMPEGVKVETKGLTICFQTDDLDGLRAKALDWALNPSDIRFPDPENRYFYVYDPDGLSIEFKQRMH
ncbi:MAG: VOC family protein [Clostridia bacterium]|nr:VOC family protein [Clostridia bacterium]